MSIDGTVVQWVAHPSRLTLQQEDPSFDPLLGQTLQCELACL